MIAIYSTKVTKLRKSNGIIAFPYDVYIGPAIRNSNWDLEQSEWSNPYQFGRTGTLQERLRHYKRDVIDKKGPKMLGKVRLLRGKTLGCICLNIRHCHGHLLAKLAQGEDKLMNVFDEASLSIDMDQAAYFKGEKCPFSNCYYDTAHLIVFQVDGSEHLLPLGIHQAVPTLKSKDMGWTTTEKSFNDAKNITELNTALRLYDLRNESVSPSNPWNIQKSLEVMFQLLKAKHLADPMFRSYCAKLGKKIPCEATINKYWSCGVDLEVLHSLDSNLVKETITSCNILGWLIQIVHTECSSSMNYSWVHDVLQGDYFPDSMKEGLRDVCECLKIMECGLLDERGKVSGEEKEEMKSSSPENGKTKMKPMGEKEPREKFWAKQLCWNKEMRRMEPWQVLDVISKQLSPSKFQTRDKEMLIQQVVNSAVTSEYKLYSLGDALRVPYLIIFAIFMKTRFEKKLSCPEPIPLSHFLVEVGTRLSRVARNVYFCQRNPKHLKYFYRFLIPTCCVVPPFYF